MRNANSKKTCVGFIAAVMFGSLCSACVFATGDITMTKLPENNPAVTKSNDYSPGEYRSVIVIPSYEQAADMTIAIAPANPEIETGEESSPNPDNNDRKFFVRKPGRREYDFAAGVIERNLMARGYRVISREIVSGLDNRSGSRADSTATPKASYDPAEKALFLKENSDAKAILIIEHLGIWITEMDYIFDDDRWIPAHRTADMEDGAWATYYLPEISIRLKLVNIENGQILWTAAGVMQARESFPGDWRAVLSVRGDEVYTESESFRLSDFNTYNSLYEQMESLISRMLETID